MILVLIMLTFALGTTVGAALTLFIVLRNIAPEDELSTTQQDTTHK